MYHEWTNPSIPGRNLNHFSIFPPPPLPPVPDFVQWDIGNCMHEYIVYISYIICHLLSTTWKKDVYINISFIYYISFIIVCLSIAGGGGGGGEMYTWWVYHSYLIYHLSSFVCPLLEKNLYMSISFIYLNYMIHHRLSVCCLERGGKKVYTWVYYWGAGIAQWLERRTRDRKVAGSNPCWSGGRIFFSRVNFLCWLLFRYPFHPRVTAVARKRPQSSCQKRWWQVTAKHAYTLRYVALHEVTWCMVVWCTQNAPRLTLSGSRFLWHHPCQRCKYTTSVDIQKRAIKTIHSCRITCERSESARERRIALYKSD